MPRLYPYYVRRGWVDEDGHIRVIQSSLRIMQSIDDVYGDETSDDDAMTDVYTYPGPSEDASDNPYTAGYFYLGEMVDLVDSMPPSPLEEMDFPPPTMGESAEDGELGSLATVTASKSKLYLQPLLLAAQSTYPVNQVSNIYTQTLPQHTTGYAPLLTNTTYPHRPINGPTTWSGLPILSLPNGSRVGQPIPLDLHPIINTLRNLRKIGNTEHPERRILKKPYEVTYENASRDGQLIRDHFASGSGLLKVDSPLRDWYGDLSVFSAKMWEFLMVQKARVIVNAKV
ncbi:hypothetical protein MBLNU13_g04912t1 [Cladosporium sp. NU13]